MVKKVQNNRGNKRKSLERPPSRRRHPRNVWLYVFPDDIWVTLPEGDTILDALQTTDVEIAGDCGGLGSCGKCQIKVLSETGEPTDEEKTLLDEEELKQGIRLACRTRVNRDMTISTAETEDEADFFKILTTSHNLPTRYIPLSQLEPLVVKKPVTISPDIRNDGLSDLDLIKSGLGPDYQGLTASLHCLRSLPERLEETQYQGAAVLHDRYLMDWQDQNQIDCKYGLVFDIGTSTLVGKLLSLVDGREVAVTSCLNSQKKYGADVISRLQYCLEHPKGMKNLHTMLLRDLNQLTEHLLKTANLQPDDIFIAVAAGNTTMQHLLLGLSPVGIAEAPFSPVVTDGLIVNAIDAGLQLHPSALFYIMPVKSGYIGGDLLSFLLTSGAAEQHCEIILGLDLGTNGEIFLGNGKRLLTCSAAAGPALEGARITHGMIARTGAIEGVSLDDDQLNYRIIGNIKPEGICGSGLVDLIAVLRRCGVIDQEGFIRPPQQETVPDLCTSVVTRSGVNSFIVATAEESYHNKPIYLTQSDVREFQLAKGAIAAGIQTLMDELSIGVADIQCVYLAGALGNYIDKYSAIHTGLIPGVDPAIVRSLGNAASTGASMVLLAKSCWQTAAELVQFIEHVELSYRSDFNQYFIEHMDFPRDNIW